jgi:WD40 repeat protein
VDSGTTLSVHTEQYRIFSTHWSPHGDMIAAGSFDGSVQIRHALDNKHLLTYQGHQGPVYAVSWSPDSHSIVSAGQEALARVWESSTGIEHAVYRQHSHAIKSVAWSPDGAAIASGGNDMTIQVWSPYTGQRYAILEEQDIHQTSQPNIHRTWIRSLAWSPDSQYIASASHKTIVLWAWKR